MKTSTIVLIVATLMLLGLTFNIGYNVGYSKVKEKIVEHSDTVYKIKVIRHTSPTPVSRLIVGTIPVPIPLHVKGDTIHDSTIVYLPLEQKMYQDPDSTYRLQISGYNANLDWIEMYQKTREINTISVMPRKRFGFSVGIGPSIIYSPFHNSIDAGVGVFAGLTYTF